MEILWRSASSQAVTGVLLLFHVKSILGRSPKVKESIENLFKYVTWLRGIHVGFHVRVQDTIAASSMWVLLSLY
jgi:hypothetical protein